VNWEASAPRPDSPARRIRRSDDQESFTAAVRYLEAWALAALMENQLKKKKKDEGI